MTATTTMSMAPLANSVEWSPERPLWSDPTTAMEPTQMNSVAATNPSEKRPMAAEPRKRWARASCTRSPRRLRAPSMSSARPRRLPSTTEATTASTGVEPVMPPAATRMTQSPRPSMRKSPSPWDTRRRRASPATPPATVSAPLTKAPSITKETAPPRAPGMVGWGG